MTRRALELLDLQSPSLILDLGCGSGLSGAILSAVPASEGGPHTWLGMDVSSSMLSTALERDDGDGVEGDLMLADIGQGIPFRPGTFDAAVSISAIQWLCNADSSDVSPQGRLARFFNGLYASLRRGARAVCQFYPRNDAQRTMISNAAIKAGFGAGILEDDPGTKNAKIYLVLTVGGTSSADQGRGGTGSGSGNAIGNGTRDITDVVHGMDDVDILDRRKNASGNAGLIRPKDLKKGSKRWIVHKKERMERQGKIVKQSSKYTGRKRRPVW